MSASKVLILTGRYVLSFALFLTLQKFALCAGQTRVAYVMQLPGNWEIRGQVPTQAFLVSLQGLANRGGPKLYFHYPEGWPYGYTRDLKEYIERAYGFEFKELNRSEEALHIFRSHAKGYVVWDPAVRTSLTIAFTIAGLDQAVVVSPEQIPMVERQDLHKAEDMMCAITSPSFPMITTSPQNARRKTRLPI